MSSAKGLSLRERTGGPNIERIVAPKTGVLRASGHNPPPTRITSGGGDPPGEGGTVVGDRTASIRDRPLHNHRGAQGKADKASGKEGEVGVTFRDQIGESQDGKPAARTGGVGREGTHTEREAVAKKATKRRTTNKNR